MNLTDEALIKHLNELEIRFAIGNFKNSNFCLDFGSCRQSHSQNYLFKTLELLSKSIISHEYEKVLQMRLSELGLINSAVRKANDVFPCTFIVDEKDDTLSLYVKQLILLFVGFSALQVFVKVNASGPSIGDSYTYPLCDILRDSTNDDIVKHLSKNGEFALCNIAQSKLLYLSKLFLLSATDLEAPGVTCHWWLMRCLQIHQQILPDRIASLHNASAIHISKTVEMKWMNDRMHILAELMFYMESAQMHLYYHEIALARKFISSAQSLVGLGIELSGAYGKRTQFQDKAVAQLFVKLRRNPDKMKDALPVDDGCICPNDLHLQDDTLLNKVSFIDVDENRIEYLLPEEQIVLLGYCCLVKRSGAFDELLREEVMSYVNCLLEQPKVWSIYLTALIMRCKAEKDSSRRLERALMQLESVISAIKKDEPPFSARVPMLYSVAFPMVWTLEKELADMWLSVGATKSALALYEKLQLWQDIVLCYQRLGRTACAERVVREQLIMKETPLLWCLLGDIKDDPEMYLKADMLAKGANARAGRSLGYYYYKRKEYQKCIPHFQKSLEINHLQSDVWFSLGYAAIQSEDFLLAASAYRQVVSLDQDNFEAWNNLSSAYIKTQQKERAWKSLQEALKCNYEEWRVWENFLLVSVDIGAFEDAIRAWHRLLDIRGKYQDSQVLEILVCAINKDLKDFYDLPSSRLKKRMLQLLGRLSSAIPNDYNIWESYSALEYPDECQEQDKEVLERATIYQQKALRFCSQTGNEYDYGFWKRILSIALRLAELSMTYIRLLLNESKIQQKSLTKLSVQGVVFRAEKHLEKFEAYEKDDLVKRIGLIQNALGEMCNL